MSFGAMVHEPCPVKYSRRVAQETGMKTRVGAQFGNASRISRFGHHGPDTPTMAFPSCPSSRPGVPAPDATLGPRFPNPDPHESHAPILRLGSAQSVGERPRWQPTENRTARPFSSAAPLKATRAPRRIWQHILLLLQQGRHFFSQVPAATTYRYDMSVCVTARGL